MPSIREIRREAERLMEMRGWNRAEPESASLPVRLAPLPVLKGGKLGKRAGKAYAGTMKAVPRDVTIKARLTRGTSVRIIDATPNESYRMHERGITPPS